MKTTEKKHWVNGYQARGGGKHKTWALSLGRYAVMITKYGARLSVQLYKLI